MVNTEVGKKSIAADHPLHVALFPWFAFGHIRPFVDLSNKLSSRGIRISFLTPPGNIPRIKTMLNLSDDNVEIIPLTIPQILGLPPGLDSTADITPSMQELLKKALDLMKPQVKEILTQLKPQFVFFDFAQYWLPELISDLNIHTLFLSVFCAISTTYIPFRTNVMNTDNVTETPTIDELKVPPHGGHHPETPLYSPLKEYEARDFVYVYKRFNGPSVVDRLVAIFKGCSALVMKSCNEMEGKYINYNKEQLKKPVLLTGTLAPPPTTTQEDHLEDKWDKWLSKFPLQSVVYCSFGSETFLNDDQIKELALGLELSGLPFILVLNFPCGVDATSELTRTFPDGFLERVKDRGLVHTGWVQQRQILAHPNVGCYLCHSGYSSVIEAMMYDCQMVLLPLKGDQFLNCKLVSEDLKAGVAIRRREEDGYFGKNDVCEAIRDVMVEVVKEPGKIIRTNQKKWREFLLDDEAQDKYILDLVEQLKAMV